MDKRVILNEQQQHAVDSNSARILCACGPGAGKTKILIERVKRLIADGSARADQIVCITFTQNAARVMQDRLPGVKLGFCSTLHSFCLKLLREHGSALGFSGTLSVLDEEQAERLLEQAIDEVDVKQVTKRDIAAAISAYPNRTRHAMAKMTRAENVAAKFCQNLRASNLVTFDTLLGYGLKLIQEQPQCCAGYSYAFVDEAQDANEIDWKIYDAMPVPNFFAVGDDSQSVFGFRGARPELFVQRALTATAG